MTSDWTLCELYTHEVLLVNIFQTHTEFLVFTDLIYPLTNENGHLTLYKLRL